MPNSPPRFKSPGQGHAREDYEHKRRYDPALSKASKIRSTVRWRKFRWNVLAKQPICPDPLGRHEGQVRGAEEVHHIRGLRVAPELAYVASNCVGLCVECHAQIEGMVRRKQATEHLFNGKGDV